MYIVDGVVHFRRLWQGQCEEVHQQLIEMFAPIFGPSHMSRCQLLGRTLMFTAHCSSSKEQWVTVPLNHLANIVRQQMLDMFSQQEGLAMIDNVSVTFCYSSAKV